MSGITGLRRKPVSPTVGITPPSSPSVLGGNRFDADKEQKEASKFSGETLPLDVLINNPYNPRHVYLEDKIRARAESLRKDGQISPVIVCPALGEATGKRFIVVDGGYRFRAAPRAGLTELKVVYRYDLDTPEKIYTAAYAANKEREDQNPYDDVLSWQKALDDGLFRNIAELCEKLGISKSVYEQNNVVAKLPFEVIELLVSGQTPIRVGCEVAKLYNSTRDVEATFEFVRAIQANDLSVREAKVQREKRVGDKAVRPRSTPELDRIPTNLGGVKATFVLKSFQSGKMVLECEEVPPDHQEEIKQKITMALSMSLDDLRKNSG